MPLIAFANSPDAGNATLYVVLVSLVILASVTILAAIPPLLIRRRRHSAAGPVGAVAFLWALGSVGLGLYTFFEQQRWAHENLIRMQSGYEDPATAVAPDAHGLLWLAVAVGYGVLLAVSIGLARRGSAARER